MRTAAGALDLDQFLRANWALHARMAEISPSVMLRSFYLSLLEMIESRTVSVQSVDEAPLPEYLSNRYRLHEDLVSAIEEQDARRALALIRVHNAPATAPATTLASAPPSGQGTGP
jgi:DNA-binding GntR family transcriptional regulator